MNQWGTNGTETSCLAHLDSNTFKFVNLHLKLKSAWVEYSFLSHKVVCWFWLTAICDTHAAWEKKWKKKETALKYRKAICRDQVGKIKGPWRGSWWRTCKLMLEWPLSSGDSSRAVWTFEQNATDIILCDSLKKQPQFSPTLLYNGLVQYGFWNSPLVISFLVFSDFYVKVDVTI